MSKHLSSYHPAVTRKQNANGLTYQRWLSAAGRSRGNARIYRAWMRGEDPSDYRASKNPLSTGAGVALGLVAAAAVIGGGYYLYTRSKSSTTKQLAGGGKTINLGIQDLGNVLHPAPPVHANAGDTIALTVGPPAPGVDWVDQSNGGVKLANVSGSVRTYNVTGNGIIALGVNLPNIGGFGGGVQQEGAVQVIVP